MSVVLDIYSPKFLILSDTGFCNQIPCQIKSDGISTLFRNCKFDFPGKINIRSRCERDESQILSFGYEKMNNPVTNMRVMLSLAKCIEFESFQMSKHCWLLHSFS